MGLYQFYWNQKYIPIKTYKYVFRKAIINKGEILTV